MNDLKSPGSDPAAAPFVMTDAALSAVQAIANWCEDKREKAEWAARWQFYNIWVLLLLGLVLLLVLPRVVSEIDRWGRDESLPPEAVAQAAEAELKLRANQTEMEGEVAKGNSALTELRVQISKRESRLSAARNELQASLTAPFSLWRRGRIRPDTASQTSDKGPGNLAASPSYTIRALAISPDGTLLAAGDWAESGEGKPLILRSADGVEWTPVRPTEYGARSISSFSDLAAAPDGTLIALAPDDKTNRKTSLILRSTDATKWVPITPTESGGQFERSLHALTVAPDGSITAVGYEGAAEYELPLILRSEGGAAWALVRPEEGGKRLDGQLYALAAAPDGALLAAGHELEGLHERKPLFMYSADGVKWTTVRPPDAVAWPKGRFYAVTASPDGTLMAGGHEGLHDVEVLILRSVDGRQGSLVRPMEAGERLKGWLSGLAATPDGQFLAAGAERGPDVDNYLILHSADGVEWTPVRLEESGKRLQGVVGLLAVAPDGNMVAASRGLLMKSVAPDEAALIAHSALTEGALPPDLIVPEGTSRRLRTFGDLETALATLRQQEGPQQRFVNTATDSLDRQVGAVKSLGEVRAKLDDALRTAEPWRQASWTATRLAVVALLIFLVQIVVNRYRYLQRLAGFYQARAHAFRVLASTAPGTESPLMRGVTMTELVSSLSPDSIGFDKAADPPTHHVATLLQSALRRGQ